MSDTSKLDNLVRRLRARVERSASREQSLDWKAADAIAHLQAECARLVAETQSLQREAAEAERHAATAPAQPLAEVEVFEPHVVSLVRALGLQEAAALLNVSYSTVYSNKGALGFFKIGGVWRVWPDALRTATDSMSPSKTKQQSPIPARKAQQRPPRHGLHDPVASARHAAVTAEYEALVGLPRNKSRNKT